MRSFPFPVKTFLLRAVLASLLLLGGCDYDSQQSALDPKGPLAENQFDLFMLTFWITLVLWVVVGGTLIYTVIRFRARKTDDPNQLPEQSHGHPLIEVGLILASTVILVILAIPTFHGIVLIHQVPEEYRKDAIEIDVTGLQWWWRFEYPQHGAIETANELVIPVGRAVKLNLRSDDVIHSFWIPKLAGKMDLMPGAQNKMWIMADEPGMYWGQCAEYCGDSHAYMLFRVIAKPEAEFAAWVEHARSAPALAVTDAKPSRENHSDLPAATLAKIQAGRELFQQHCLRCHRIGEEGGVAAPNLTHLASRSTIAAGWMENTPENLHQWILAPNKIKPGNNMWLGMPMTRLPNGAPDRSGMVGLKDAGLTPSQVDALVSYLQLLK